MTKEIEPNPYITHILYNPNYIMSDSACFLKINGKEVNISDIRNKDRLADGNQYRYTSVAENFGEYFKDKPIIEIELDNFYANQTGYIFDAFLDSQNLDRDLAIVSFIYSVTDNPKVLDYGGGTGNLSMLAKTYGLDITYYDLGITKEFAQYRFNKYKLNIPTEIKDKYDVIITTEFFEHLYNPEEKYREIIKLLNPKGFLIYTESCSAKSPEHLKSNLKYREKESIKLLEKLGLKEYTRVYWNNALYTTDMLHYLRYKTNNFMVMQNE